MRNDGARLLPRRKRPRASVARAMLYLFCCLVFLFLVAPIFVIVPISFSSSPYLTFPPPGWSLQWYRSYLHSTQWLAATGLSVEIGLGVMVLATIMGTLASLGLARGQFRSAEAITAFLLSPMIVPVIILAIAIYHLYARVHLIGTAGGIIIAHTVLALPYVLVTVSASLQGVDRNLEKAARTLGASAMRSFFEVTLPLMRTGVFAGALFAFITSFDEVVIAIFVGGSTAITLPKQMWEGIRDEIDPTISAAATLMVATSVLVLGALTVMTRRTERLRGSKPHSLQGDGHD